MPTYVGEGITVVCTAKDPVSGTVISDAVATVEFYAPDKRPARNPADRVADYGPVSMSYDADIDGGSYVAYVDTTGWTAGRWTYRVTLSGAYSSWEYGTLRLVA